MKARIATAWLDGCSGCHMSLLDMDDRLLALADKFDLVYSPVVDIKDFPENVDVTLVEGAVGNEDELAKLRRIRERSRLLVALGDCAVTANVPSMRNPFGVDAVLQRAFLENTQQDPQIPSRGVPPLMPNAQPLHEWVKVDIFVPGCPPSADTIYYVLSELVEGRIPDLDWRTRFGE